MGFLNLTQGAGAKLGTSQTSGGEHVPWKIDAVVDSAGVAFNPDMGSVTTAYTRTDGQITGVTLTSVVGGVTRIKTTTYVRDGGLVVSQTESPWVSA